MTITQYSMSRGQGYHIKVDGSAMEAWVENYEPGSSVNWSTSVNSIRAHEIGQNILRHDVKNVDVYMREGEGERVAISGLKQHLAGREDDVSVVSVRVDALDYRYVWARSLTDDNAFELGVVGRVPPFDIIRALIDVSSPEMLAVEGFDLMHEIERSVAS